MRISTGRLSRLQAQNHQLSILVIKHGRWQGRSHNRLLTLGDGLSVVWLPSEVDCRHILPSPFPLNFRHHLILPSDNFMKSDCDSSEQRELQQKCYEPRTVNHFVNTENTEETGVMPRRGLVRDCQANTHRSIIATALNSSIFLFISAALFISESHQKSSTQWRPKSIIPRSSFHLFAQCPHLLMFRSASKSSAASQIPAPQTIHHYEKIIRIVYFDSYRLDVTVVIALT